MGNSDKRARQRAKRATPVATVPEQPLELGLTPAHNDSGPFLAVPPPTSSLPPPPLPANMEPDLKADELNLQAIELRDFLNSKQETVWTASLRELLKLGGYLGVDSQLIHDINLHYQSLAYQVISENRFYHLRHLKQTDETAYQEGLEAGIFEERTRQNLLSDIAPPPLPLPSQDLSPTIKLPLLPTSAPPPPTPPTPSSGASLPSCSTNEQGGSDLSVLYTALDSLDLWGVSEFCSKSENTQHNFAWQLWTVAFAAGANLKVSRVTIRTASSQTDVHTSEVSIQTSTPKCDVRPHPDPITCEQYSQTSCEFVEASVQTLLPTPDVAQPPTPNPSPSPSSLSITPTSITGDDPSTEAAAATLDILPVQSSTCSWADDIDSCPILPTYYPKYPPRDLSCLNSGNPSPFRTNSHRIPPRRRTYQQSWSLYPPPRRPQQFRKLSTTATPPPPVNLQTKLNWNEDPRLFELGRALNALGWIRA